MTEHIQSITIRPGNPDFQDLPWQLPLSEWSGCCVRLEEVHRGLSRHPVVFANYNGALYALKELPPGTAQHEYEVLSYLEEQHLPAVSPVGFINTRPERGEASILITRYLDQSLPVRSLFMRSGLMRYHQHLLNAMADLNVQLHLAGIFWGDCSLSNTLFRRDAGTLQAYLVDAETAEIHSALLPPTLRLHDLEIMEENINGDVHDLESTGNLGFLNKAPFLARETGTYIRQFYQNLWREITQEQIINPEEHYRIQERIRALNNLGFSIGQIQMEATDKGQKLRFRVIVTDRNFHRNQLMNLTGLEAEDMQARQMINEIQEVKGSLSQANNRSTPLSVAAYYWLENMYQPVLQILTPLLKQKDHPDEYIGPTELYCQVLEHKWYLSERKHHDVGHQAAARDYLTHFAVS